MADRTDSTDLHLLDSSLGIGLGIQLQIKGVESRFKSRYFGMKPGEYLIIQMPGDTSLRDKILSGAEMVVRYLQDGSIYGFESRIIGYALKPSPMLFLSFPTAVEAHSLRSSRRIDTFLEATASLNGNEIRGVILDLSNGGCRFAIDRASSERHIKVETGDLLHLHLALTDRGQVVDIIGQAITTREEGNGIDVGLKFLFSDEDEHDAAASLQVKAYVDNVIAFLDRLSADR